MTSHTPKDSRGALVEGQPGMLNLRPAGRSSMVGLGDFKLSKQQKKLSTPELFGTTPHLAIPE